MGKTRRNLPGYAHKTSVATDKNFIRYLKSDKVSKGGDINPGYMGVGKQGRGVYAGEGIRKPKSTAAFKRIYHKKTRRAGKKELSKDMQESIKNILDYLNEGFKRTNRVIHSKKAGPPNLYKNQKADQEVTRSALRPSIDTGSRGVAYRKWVGKGLRKHFKYQKLPGSRVDESKSGEKAVGNAWRLYSKKHANPKVSDEKVEKLAARAKAKDARYTERTRRRQNANTVKWGNTEESTIVEGQRRLNRILKAKEKLERKPNKSSFITGLISKKEDALEPAQNKVNRRNSVKVANYNAQQMGSAFRPYRPKQQ